MTTSACVCRSALIKTTNVRNKNTRLMKQTNNAIKFLMAQYRAIFKNAYFKGMASAVLLTAGLAVAGGAQATGSLSNTVWDSLEEADEPYTVDGSGSAANTFDKIEITSSATNDDKAFILNISGVANSSTNKIEASSAAAVEVKASKATINLSGEDATKAALTIKGDASKVATLQVGTFTVGNGQLTLESAATSDSGAASLKASTIKLTGGTSDGVSKIVFKGTSAAAAVLSGKLVADSSTHLTTLDFTGNGTLETYGTDVNVKISVATGASAENKAVLSIVDDEDTTDINEGLLSIKSGTISIGNGDAATKKGVFQVNKGILELGKEVTVTASGTETSGASTLQVSGSDASDATLRIYADTVKSFLAGKSDGTVAGGSLDVAKGTVELLDTTEIDLATDLGAGVFAADAAAGKINFGTGSIIKGNKLAVSDTLTGATNLNIEATTLTLGSATYDSTTGFGFNSATTQSLNLVQSGSGAFVLKDAITLKATQQVDNIYTEASGDKITIAGQGGNIANQDLILNGGSKALTIAAGHFTGNVDVELKSGSLTVGLGSASAGDLAGIDASLTFAAGTTLTLNNADADNGNNSTIKVQGNGNATWDGVTGNRTATSTLDLRQADIKFTSTIKNADSAASDYTKLTTFDVQSGGELLVTEDQMNYLLNNIHNPRASTVSGAGFLLSGDGAVIVDGDLEVAVGDLGKATGTTATTDTIKFSGGGVLEADSLTINDNPTDRLTDFTADGLDIGSGELVAETIALNNNHLVSATAGLQDTFTVKDGDLYVGSSLTSVNSKVALGDGTSGASLTLGYISNNYDQYGIALPETEENAYTLSAETGTVQPSLVLNGGTSSENSALNVEYGAWTINNLTATNATITVGQDSSNQKHDINGNAYTTSLTGQGLTLNGGTTMTVNNNGAATFETLALNGGTATVDNTTLTINGKYVAPVEDNTATPDKDETVAESWGLSATTGTITVQGREGQLILGADAVKGISTTKNADGVYKYTNKNDAQNAFVTLKDWATLSLGLGSSVTFDKTSLQELRKDFIFSNTTGNVLTQGFINIGKAQIAGINTSTGTISWDDLEGYKDIIADILQTGLTGATLIDVNASDNIQANVGNVLADASTPVLNFGDTTLHQADANGNFISNEAGTEVDANVIAGAHFAVYNGGNLADVTLQGGTETSTTEFAVIASATEGATEPETTIKSVTAASDADDTSFYVAGKTTVTGNVDVGEVVLAKDLTVNGKTYISEGLNSAEDASGNLVTTGTLTTNDTLEVLGGADFAGNIVANNTATFGAANGSDTYSINGVSYQHDYYFAGNNTFKNVNLYNGVLPLLRP